MAKLELDGFDDLLDAFARIGDVPGEVLDKTLTAMETVAADKIKASGESMGVRDQDPMDTVHILDKVKMNRPKRTDTGGYADVTFSGSRTRSGINTRNAEIAFVNEYGKRSQQARPFVGQAMEQNADAIANAGAEVLLDWTEKEFAK